MLFRLQGSSDAPLLVEESHSDMAEGKYRFGALTPGKYLPSVSIEAPFKTGEKQKRFYYPGAPSPGQATEIKIEESESLSGKDIKLPPGHVVRQIEGVVVWSDGRPVKGWATLAGKERLGEQEQRVRLGQRGRGGAVLPSGIRGSRVLATRLCQHIRDEDGVRKRPLGQRGAELESAACQGHDGKG